MTKHCCAVTSVQNQESAVAGLHGDDRGLFAEGAVLEKPRSRVNLAWSAAIQSSRRTLLWDLDPQAASSWLLGDERKAKDAAQAVFAKDVSPERLIIPTDTAGLDLLRADASLRGLDQFFFELGKRKRLAKLLEDLNRTYDRIILDCPPGLTENQ